MSQIQRPEADLRTEQEMGGSLEDRWRALVAAQGPQLAVADDSGTLSYSELDEQSDTLAESILAARARDPLAADTPTAVLVGHGRLAVVAALADLKAGTPQLTLDPSVPSARLAEIVRSSGARIGVAAAEHAELAAEVGLLDVVAAGRPDRPAASMPRPRRPWVARSLDDIHGITYTSGSTGTPKGVAVRLRTIPHELLHRADADWCRPGDVVAMVMPLSFGAARGELSTAMFLGAQLHFFDPRVRGAGPLAGWISERGVTMLAAPPSLLTALVRTLGAGERLADSLRMVRSSGEKVLCSEAVDIRRALPPGCRLINAFGSSEATLISAYEIDASTPDIPRPVPAGWPLPDREIRLEREDGTEPEPGETGELIVVSRYLPAGYWRDEVRTAQRFVPLGDGRVALRTGDLAVALPDGSYRLAGRKDLSLKIRGNLVEPAEVEAALLHCTGVQEAVVVGRPGRSGKDRLVAYLVLRRGADVVHTAALRRELLTRVPSYMVPEAVVYLPELPRNERGKLDRAALPEPTRPAADDATAPRTAWEAQVAQVWAEVLELEAVGVDEDFFELGGDSLAAEELVTRLAERHGLEVGSKVLVEAPTVAEFAALATAAGTTSDDTLVPLRRTGTRPPLFCVAGAGLTGMAYLPLARSLGEDQPVWGLQARRRRRGGLPQWSVRRAARDYVDAVRSVQPTGPYLLAGHSFGAVLAFEMAQQLRAAGSAVALLVVLDSFAPHPRELPRPRPRSLREWATTFAGLTRTAVGEAPAPGVVLPFVRQSHAASMLYRGRPYRGRTLVVVAADEPALVPRRSEPWGRYLSGAWTVQPTPGTHMSMLREPHVPALAERLRAALDAALR